MDGIGLAEAIEMLRGEIVKAQAAAGRAAVHFPIESLTVELKVGLTKEAGGKAGFKVPVIDLELGANAGLKHEALQTVSLVLGPPRNAQDQPVSVSEITDEDLG